MVSDNPLKVNKLSDKGMWGSLFHFYFPLSSSICLHLFPRIELSRIGTNATTYEHKYIKDTDINHINSLTNQQKDRYLYARRKELIDRFLV